MILVLDYGSQYTQIIARRIRGMGVLAVVHPPGMGREAALAMGPAGIVLSGGPASVYEKGAPTLPDWVLECGIPVLGVCYGMQLIARAMGGEVSRSDRREYGPAKLGLRGESALTAGLPKSMRVWMSHGDSVGAVPRAFRRIAASANCPYAAIEHRARPVFGIQFHPEVFHSEHGEQWLRNFVFGVCRAKRDWRMKDFVAQAEEQVRAQAGKGTVVCAVSGGVDSTVLAVLLHRAIGTRAKPVLVDHGLLRAGEAAWVKEKFAGLGLKLQVIDASAKFLGALRGVSDPEEKRRIIGRTFIEVFYPHIGGKDLLAQGTLYPDVIESVSLHGPSATIKTHHNRVKEVLELMEQGRVVEPLRELFKDEVRAVGKLLGIPKELLGRHPFPGPGLAIRVLGAVTPERLEVLRKADAIYLEELRKAGQYDKIWQAFAVLLPVSSVGVMGDGRTYENVLALRAVTSVDGMTADWYPMPHEVLGRISARIINEVRGVNRVVYDASSKPPATIEWE